VRTSAHAEGVGRDAEGQPARHRQDGAPGGHVRASGREAPKWLFRCLGFGSLPLGAQRGGDARGQIGEREAGGKIAGGSAGVDFTSHPVMPAVSLQCKNERNRD